MLRIPPRRFWRLTIGEFLLLLRAECERRMPATKTLQQMSYREQKGTMQELWQAELKRRKEQQQAPE